MVGNDYWLVATILLGILLVVWLILDSFENIHQHGLYDVDLTSNQAYGISTGEQCPEPLDAEIELLLCYPLDAFAPAIFWRPLPQDGWIEAQETVAQATVEQATVASLSKDEAAATVDTSPSYLPVQS